MCDMAIVESGRTSNGVRYFIDDDCAAKKGTPEYDRIAAEQCRIAYGILLGAARRKQAEMEQQNAQGRK